MDYESMVDLFVRSGLEISPEDPRPDGLITCFELVDVQENRRIGASGLCCDADEYILRCVAVEEEFRGMGYGRKLVEAVTADGLEQSGSGLQRRCRNSIRSSGFRWCQGRKPRL